MAIAFDAQTINFNNALARPASQTFSHTCTGTNRYLFIAVECSVNGAITGITFNGVPMTELGTIAGGASVFEELIVYGIANPPTGANTVSIQTTGSGNVYLYTAVGSYTGVNQTTPNPHSGSNSSGGATSLTLTIDTSTSPSTDNCWIIAGGFTNGNYTATAGAGTTKRVTGSVEAWISIYDNNVAITPAGSDSLVVNISTSSELHIIGVSLAPALTNTTVSPSAQALAFSLPAETVRGNARVSVNAQVATLSLPTRTVTADWKVNVNTQVATFSVPAYTVLAGGIAIAPNTQNLTFSLPAETVLGNAIVSPDAQSLTFTVPARTVTADWQVGVNPVVLTVTLPTLQFVGALWGRTPRTTTGADWTRSVKNNDA